jgi:hypothetical protein
MYYSCQEEADYHESAYMEGLRQKELYETELSTKEHQVNN